MKTVQWEPSFYMLQDKRELGRQAGTHNKANSGFLQFCEGA